MFSLPHANPMEQSPNQLSHKMPILKYTRQREIEILLDVIYIHQAMLPAKFYCFAVAKTNAAISLERVTNAQLLCLQAERCRQRRRLFTTIQYNTTSFISNKEHNYIITTMFTQHWDGWKGGGQKNNLIVVHPQHLIFIVNVK